MARASTTGTDSPRSPVHPPQVAAYSFSFLTGALYRPESAAVAELVRAHGDWPEVARRAAEGNLLRQRTIASRTRLLREIRYRLEQFTPPELDFFCEADSRDQRQLLFIAVCQRFRFIREFVVEIIRPRAFALDCQLYPTDFARFFDRKGADAPEVDRLTDKSRAKVKQVLIRMLAEGGLIDSTAKQEIQRPMPSAALCRLIAATESGRLRFLLLSDADIRQLAS